MHAFFGGGRVRTGLAIGLLLTLVITTVQPLWAQQRCCPDAGSDTWAFRNFRTNRLRWDTFAEAFRLNREHALDTLIAWPFFYAFRDSLGSGNCFGMSLLSEEVFQSRGLRAPFSGNLQERIGEAYPPRTVGTTELPTDNDLRLDINTRQWRQMSVEYLRRALDTVAQSPAAQAERIYQDTRTTSFQSGVVSITHGWGGHTMTVFSCTKGGRRGEPPVYDLLLYDPNRPFRGAAGRRHYPHLQPMRITGNRWSFTMADGRVWSNDDGMLAYVPWTGSRLWSKIPSNLVDVFIILLGDGARVEQVTDGQNRKLFKRPAPRSLADLDVSPQGLGQHLLPIVPLTQRPIIRPPRARRAVERLPDDDVPQAARVLGKRFGPSVERAREAYFGDNVQLRNLKFQASSADPRRPTAMTILHHGKWWEVRGEPGVSMEVEIPSIANLADGIRVRQRAGSGKRVTISYAQLDTRQRALEVQRVQDIPLPAESVRVQLASDGAIRVASAANLQTLTLNREAIDAQGRVRSLGVQRITPVRGAGPAVQPEREKPAAGIRKPRIRIRPPARPKN